MKKMNEFKTYHPVVNFTYFVFVIGFTMFFMHPLCLVISLLCAFSYLLMLKKFTTMKTNIIYIVQMMILMALINPAFNHRGVTVIFYLPGGNPITMESIFYGLATSLMIVSVICHFLCYNEVVTSDKFIYLFGKTAPSLSLILSMTLRFVPEFISRLKKVADAHRCMGKDMSSGGVIKRIKCALSVLSVTVTCALENTIETADSMKSRGYGLRGRTAFSIFVFDKRDMLALICIIALGIYTFFGYVAGGMDFSYFPEITYNSASLFSISVFAAYFFLCAMPVMIEIREVIRWRCIKSKI